MALSGSPCLVSTADHYAIVSIEPMINDARWGEIEKMGNEVLQQLDEENSTNVIVNLEAMDFMGSSVVALIVRIWKKVSATEGQMIVVVRSPVVLEVLEIAGLTKVWDISQNLQDAIESISEDSQGGSAKLARPASPSGKEATGSPWVSGLGIVALVGAIVCFAAVAVPEGEEPSRNVLLGGLLFSVAGVVLGLVSAFRYRGVHRALGIIVVLLCLGLSLAGLLNIQQ